MKNIKPNYLVLIKNNKTPSLFLTIDKPDYSVFGITVKGFFVKLFNEKDFVSDGIEVLKNINNELCQTILQSTNKDQIMEMVFPWSEIYQIKSAGFKAK
ncbi:MAG: hypothetical protein LC122_12810 [Chitinophagales bacterium]|nr:hypothetical protein [Chitinophagales bacterium]